MKRLLFICFMLAAAWSPCRLQAQESHIGFSVKYDDASGKLDEDNTKLLCNKIQQVIARSNAGCVSASEVLFAIRPELTITQDDVVRTGMQDIHVYQAELTLYAVGCADNNVFHSTIVQLKGNGRSQHEAERQMLTRLNASDPRLTRFIHTSQERIEEFFVNNAPVFIAKADLLAKQGRYEEAKLILSVIPETVSGYDVVLNRMGEYYQKQVDMDAEKALNNVDVLLVKGDMDAALDILAGIDPLSKHYSAAKGKVAGIKASIDAEMAAAAAERAERLELDMEAEQRRIDNETRQVELAKAAQMSSKNALSGDIGDMLLECVKDIAVGFITK